VEQLAAGHARPARAAVVNPVGVVWEMYASAGPEGSEEKLRHFGPLGYAQQDTTAQRVVRVELTPTDEPTEDDYWAWWDDGAWQPSCIHDSEEKMTAQFLLGQPDAPGPRDEQEVGLGQILRLQVTVLPEEVYLRSGRTNWRYSSAL
jgi:hypothetical protein